MIRFFKELFHRRKSERVILDLIQSQERGYIARESDIHSIHDTWKKLQNSNRNEYDDFYNVCLYSSIVGRDIAFLWDKFTITERAFEKNLYGRLLCMTIIEFLDDINKLLGKRLRQELERNGITEFMPDLNEINKKFSDIKKQYSKELKLIRNNCAAHKTKSAIDLLDFTSKENFKNLHHISTEVSRTDNLLTKFTTKVILKITNDIIVER